MKFIALIAMLFIACSPAPTSNSGSGTPEPVDTMSIQPDPGAQCKSPTPALPDPLCTPGIIRTQDLNIICHQPTSQFRPTLAQERVFKREVLKMYGLENAKWGDYQLDALIPLEAGGDHFNLKNMWPMPVKIAHKKDLVEHLAKREICSGQKTPAEIQAAFMGDWRTIK